MQLRQRTRHSHYSAATNASVMASNKFRFGEPGGDVKLVRARNKTKFVHANVSFYSTYQSTLGFEPQRLSRFLSRYSSLDTGKVSGTAFCDGNGHVLFDCKVEKMCQKTIKKNQGKKRMPSLLCLQSQGRARNPTQNLRLP